LPDSPIACVILPVAFQRRRIKKAKKTSFFGQAFREGWFDRSREGRVTDDAIAKNILKFVRQLDGVDSDEGVLKAAIAHRWLDRRGAPTPAGRKLIDSFDTLQRIGQTTA